MFIFLFDAQVFDNPTYRPARGPDGGEARTMNQYEETEPIYDTIDDEQYEKVQENRKEPSRKKSRTNPVYNMDEEADDSLNPVVNLSLSSPRKTSNSEKVNHGYDSDTDDSVIEEDTEDSNTGMSTFKSYGSSSAETSPAHHRGAVMTNPLYEPEVKQRKTSEKSMDGEKSFPQNNNEQDIARAGVNDEFHSTC